VSASDPTFSTRDENLLGVRRYWRGPTWINSAWLVWLGLVRLGYEDAAAQLVHRVAGAVGSQGLREYYNPRTGHGMGAVDFGWSSLVLELIAPDPRAGTSYLS
jgi:glycogen debranching enzyme